uniref:Uncharacterized protein n=1 Tax=Cyprinus carpio TaxID=7962 RepID=A0A8C2BSH0_CYPCA
ASILPGHFPSKTTKQFMLTGDLHHPIFGLHRQLLWGEVIDIQADLPGIWRLLDLRYSRAHLSGKGPAVVRGVHHGGGGRHWHLRPNVSGPVCAGKCGHLLGEVWHPKGLIEEPAALGPVAERVPGWAVHKGEGDASLGHG